MSSENLKASADDQYFVWSDALAANDYVVATYRIETALDPWRAALAMAREQSAAVTDIEHLVSRHLREHTARVLSCDEVQDCADAALLPEYRLNTPVYADGEAGERVVSARVRIAFPVRNLRASVSSLLNHVVGELARLGFLRAVCCVDIVLPEPWLRRFAGPAHGHDGLRAKLGVQRRPLFCRSTRPAVGLDDEEMVAIAQRVLAHGFDCIKDDELTEDLAPSTVDSRWPRLLEVCDAVARETSERKLFFANLIGDDEQALLQSALASGVAASLVAPGINGFGALARARDAGLVVLAHNSGSDFLTRSPRLGISPALWLRLCRIAGADLVMLPGEFASGALSTAQERALIDALVAPLPGIAPAWPILAGGKRAENLADYQRRVGSADFMLIVAAAVDHHPDGVAAGARAFRAAWRELETA